MGDQASLGLDVTYTKPEEEAKDAVQVVAVQPVAIVDHLLTVGRGVWNCAQRRVGSRADDARRGVVWGHVQCFLLGSRYLVRCMLTISPIPSTLSCYSFSQ